MTQNPDALRELKHSVTTHLGIMGGPTDQLCALLLKVVDFIDDSPKREAEMFKLSYYIIEGLAVYVHRFLDAKPVTDSVKEVVNDILVTVGRARNAKTVDAKYAVMRSMATALAAVGAVTHDRYPKLLDSNGNPL